MMPNGINSFLQVIFMMMVLKHILPALHFHRYFEVTNKLEILRADKIGKEFGINYIIKGGGDEYQAFE